MKISPSKLVKIAQKPASSKLSNGQKLFKKLIKKIDGQREQLLTWQKLIPIYQQKNASEFEPLLENFNAQRTQLVMLFDRAVESKLFTKTERTKLADLITSIAGEILDRNDTPELKAIFNKYNEEDFDSQNDLINADAKAMMEEMFGRKIEGDVDVNDPDALLKMMAEQGKIFHEQEAAREESYQSSRKKTAKQLAKDAKLEQEEKNISLSIREVFRKLASTLHPDREQDATERARKTALMQRVNVAYDNKDLLQLLELQLEVEQIDESLINNISAEKLKHYNVILHEQSGELEMEIEDCMFAFTLRFQLPPHPFRTAASALADLEDDIVDMRDMIAGIAEDVQRFQETKTLKAWLKDYRVAPPPMFHDSMFDDVDFGFNFDPMPKRR